MGFNAIEAINDIIDDINANTYESYYDEICDELDYRVESGELSLEDAQIIADKAAEEYLEDVVTEKIFDAPTTAAAIAVGAGYGTSAVNTALFKKTQKDIKKAKELRDTLLEIEKQVDSCKDENKRQELMKKFLKIRNEQLRILDKAKKRLKVNEKVNNAEPWVKRAGLAIASLNVAYQGMNLAKTLKNKK